MLDVLINDLRKREHASVCCGHEPPSLCLATICMRKMLCPMRHSPETLTHPRCCLRALRILLSICALAAAACSNETVPTAVSAKRSEITGQTPVPKNIRELTDLQLRPFGSVADARQLLDLMDGEERRTFESLLGGAPANQHNSAAAQRVTVGMAYSDPEKQSLLQRALRSRPDLVRQPPISPSSNERR